jgi:hypothetical protein
VRFRFVGLPANAAAYVDGRPVGPEGVADVPRSDVPVEVSVVAAGGAREPYVDRVVPDRDRTIRVPFPSTGPPRARPDAGAGTLRTDEGTVFATQWR